MKWTENQLESLLRRVDEMTATNQKNTEILVRCLKRAIEGLATSKTGPEKDFNALADISRLIKLPRSSKLEHNEIWLSHAKKQKLSHDRFLGAA